MNITVDELIAEIGRLHIQLMAQAKVIADLSKAAVVPPAKEATPQP